MMPCHGCADRAAGERGYGSPVTSGEGLAFGLRHDSEREHAVASRSVQGSWPDRRTGDMDNMSIILGLLCNLENKYLHNDPVLHLVKHRVHSHLELDEYPLRSALKGTHSLGQSTEGS